MPYKLRYHLLYTQNELVKIRDRYQTASRREVSDLDLWDFLHGFVTEPESSTYEEAVESEDASDDFSLVTDRAEDQEGHGVSPENEDQNL